MDGFEKEFEDFMNNVLSFPEGTYIGCLCTNGGLFIFNKDDKKFHSTNNEIIREFSDPLMYNYDESTNRHIMCVMIFPSLDYMLEYISAHTYEKDIAKFMLQIKSQFNDNNV